MKHLRQRLAILGLLGAAALATGSAVAAPVMVHGVVPPAWIERAGRTLPLRPGAVILESDRLVTGDGGRIELDLPDGSMAKLGGASRLELPRARMMRAADDDVFDAALHLLKGAFRFTTRLAAKSMKRDVRLRVGTVTIGVRGTDYLVVAGDDGDHIMLVEGRIEVSGDAMAAPMVMAKPMDLMMFDKGGAMMAMPPMAMPQLMDEMHAMEAMVMMPKGQGMLMMDMAPVWDVVVASFRTRAKAERVAAALAAEGWPTEVQEGVAFGETRQRVAVTGFPSKAEALGFRARIEGVQGITGAWLKRR